MFNEAQHILLALGVDPIALVAHARGKTPSWTKKGPGRRHQHRTAQQLRERNDA